MPFLLHQKFLETANRLPKKTALQLRESGPDYKRYTYAEALNSAKALGFWFIRQGIKKQDRVAIILENGPQWPLFYFGILFAGAAAVPIDTQFTQQEIKNILADSGAKLTISKSNADEILRNLKDKDAPADFNFPQLDLEDLASILYTSGTTAQPKGVELSHKNFSSNFESLNKLKICNERDNVISILPLHHSYSFTVTLLLPLSLGATVTYVKTLKPEEILSAMREAGVTLFVGVPQLFYLFHKGIAEKIREVSLPLWLAGPFIYKKVRSNFGSKLRFFASGGARLDPTIAGNLSKFGFTILEGYGLTETSPVVTFNPLKRQKFGSVGVAIPDVEIKILNPDKDSVGEVLIRGPNVMKGYYKRPDETNEVIKDGWFYSGDLGYIDKDGYLFLTGRKKEIIVLSNGKNIYPEETEAHYQRSPFIKELCVLGILKEGSTEELGAVIVPDIEHFKKTGEVNIREKIKWDLENFSKELPFYKRIMGFVIVKEDLPRTRLGKIKRYEVEARYKGEFDKEGTMPKGQGSKAEDDEILNSYAGKKVMEFLVKERNIKRAIKPDDHLELDLGIDSLGRVELAVGLEKAFGIGISEENMAQIFTIKDVILKIIEIISKKTQTQDAGRVISDEAMWKAILGKEPKEKIKTKIELSPSIFSKVFAFFVMGSLRVIFRLFFGLKVKGNNNIPKESPFILCPNHSSYLDAFSVVASISFNSELDLFFLGFREYFNQPIVRDLIKVMRVIPIDPAVELLNAIQASSFVISNKKSLCIFPEGQRSMDGEVKEFKKGIGILAKELHVTLVPVYIEGAHEAWPRSKKFPRLFPIKVIFGKPLNNEHLLKAGKARGAKDDYEAITIGLREEVLKLRGV